MLPFFFRRWRVCGASIVPFLFTFLSLPPSRSPPRLLTFDPNKMRYTVTCGLLAPSVRPSVHSAAAAAASSSVGLSVDSSRPHYYYLYKTWPPALLLLHYTISTSHTPPHQHQHQHRNPKNTSRYVHSSSRGGGGLTWMRLAQAPKSLATSPRTRTHTCTRTKVGPMAPPPPTRSIPSLYALTIWYMVQPLPSFPSLDRQAPLALTRRPPARPPAPPRPRPRPPCPPPPRPAPAAAPRAAP